MAALQPIRIRADAQDLTGKRFGRWTVLGLAKRGHFPSGQPYLVWHCRCDCGSEKNVASRVLREAKSQSCGCLRKKYGAGRMRSYQVWRGMMRRCYNKKDAAYPLYGGQGVLVFLRWHDFKNFYQDMGDAPRDLSIDHIDTFGNYEP